MGNFKIRPCTTGTSETGGNQGLPRWVVRLACVLLGKVWPAGRCGNNRILNCSFSQSRDCVSSRRQVSQRDVAPPQRRKVVTMWYVAPRHASTTATASPSAAASAASAPSAAGTSTWSGCNSPRESQMKRPPARKVSQSSQARTREAGGSVRRQPRCSQRTAARAARRRVWSTRVRLEARAGRERAGGPPAAGHRGRPSAIYSKN
jgi:hypothetical protein